MNFRILKSFILPDAIIKNFTGLSLFDTPGKHQTKYTREKGEGRYGVLTPLFFIRCLMPGLKPHSLS